jgi:hypothetical protein
MKSPNPRCSPKLAGLSLRVPSCSFPRRRQLRCALDLLGKSSLRPSVQVVDVVNRPAASAAKGRPAANAAELPERRSFDIDAPTGFQIVGCAFRPHRAKAGCEIFRYEHGSSPWSKFRYLGDCCGSFPENSGVSRENQFRVITRTSPVAR